MRTEYPCKILVIEDDAGICRFLRATLTAAHYDVIVTDTGKKALEIISSHCPDCILLDLGLPDLDGNDIIQSIRGWTKTPIIVISARSTEEDKARALDLGADDYLTKPFGSIELMARIRTALRHTRTTMENDSIALSGVYTVRGLTVDYKKHRVFMNGTDTGLTPNEYRIVARQATTKSSAFIWPTSAAKSNPIPTSRDTSSLRSAWATAWQTRKATNRGDRRKLRLPIFI